MDGDWKSQDYAAHYNKLYATPAEEFQALAAILRLAPGDRIVDFGCGNGDFLQAAMRVASSGLGVDISDEQLALARRKFAGDSRVEFIKTPFLDFAPGPRTFTRGFSRKALHHLTDGEKAVFFAKVGPHFEPGSLFLLEDGIMDFERADLEANWDRLMNDCAAYYGDLWEQKKADVSFCFRSEYPAGIKAWTAAFAAGGFKLLNTSKKSSFYGSILAEKSR